ncbi:MAG: hypothetical protein JXR46_02615 [Calditrichaceae bacterium]|nr:hypothetical protein [Calditrichaceae bacterium]MBN2707915.1 hypothetical protein [Calditrichaceae bacterium]RQV92321.1 MAG: hypothetical protein EH224_15895 [Calditrichota bacterium]
MRFFILPAFEVTPVDKPDKFAHFGHRIIPNPTRKFDKSKLIYLYYEIYNLILDSDGIATYQVEQTVSSGNTDKSLFAKFFDLFRSKQEKIIITKEQQTTASRTMDYTAFDFNELDSGLTEIIIKITDKNSGESAEIKSSIILY